MRARIVKKSIPITETTSMYVYKVEWQNYQIVGCHESSVTTGTFGVYENLDVAKYVKKAIEKGGIRPVPVEIEHGFDDNDDLPW